MGLANLHDAFLQASLVRTHMEQSPPSTDPHVFLMSDRGRFERLWVALLYVLVEAWQSNQMREVTEHIQAKTSLAELDQVLQEGAAGEQISSMREVRHYVCHRDKREYWDKGRVAAIGNLAYHQRLHDAFSKVLLAAMQQGVSCANSV
jgi:hypothetical protein